MHASIHGLEEFEREGDERPPFILSYAEVKLLGIAGVKFASLFSLPVLTSDPQVGFFLDGMDA